MSIKLDIWGALIYNSMRKISFAKGKMTMYNDMPDSIDFLKNYDPELAASMERELCRQRSNIELIASENFVSPAVLAAMGTFLQINMQRGIRVTGITEAAAMLTKWKTLRATVPANFSARSTPMFSRIPAHRQTLPHISHLRNTATQLWEWIFRRAVTLPTEAP